MAWPASCAARQSLNGPDGKNNKEERWVVRERKISSDRLPLTASGKRLSYKCSRILSIHRATAVQTDQAGGDTNRASSLLIIVYI